MGILYYRETMDINSFYPSYIIVNWFIIDLLLRIIKQKNKNWFIEKTVESDILYNTHNGPFT